MIGLGETSDDQDLLNLPHARLSIKASNEIVSRKVSKAFGYGTIKESFGRGDWEVTIAGTLLPDKVNRDQLSGEPTYPYSLLEGLSKLLTVGKALRLVNDRTARLGIDRVVVMDFELPDTPGLSQPYSIRCLSDYPFELLLS